MMKLNPTSDMSLDSLAFELSNDIKITGFGNNVFKKVDKIRRIIKLWFHGGRFDV